MSSGANGEWVRQGTPSEDSADWNEEQSEYGTAMSPTEWDDYSSEQSVPVTPPRREVAEGVTTAGSPGSPDEQHRAPVPADESVSSENSRPEEGGAADEGKAEVDAGDDGVKPEPVDEMEAPAEAARTEVDDDSAPGAAAEVHDEVTRPRPMVPENAMVEEVPADIGASESSEGLDRGEAVDEGRGQTGDAPAEVDAEKAHVDEAEPVAVDPVDRESVNEAAETHPVSEDVGDEPTQYVATDDMEATQTAPMGTTAAGGVAATEPGTVAAVPDGLYRADGAEATAVISPDAYPSQDVDVEEERLLAQLEAERLAREQRLGAVPTSTDNATREDAGPAKITTDKVFPSFGLFVLRLVTAGILGLTSFQILGSGVDITAEFLGGYPLIPEPRLVAWILGFTLGALALLLVIGMMQRVVGFLLLVIAVSSLVFLRWGNFPIFVKDVEGFIGDKDVLLAAVGLLLLTIGGGAWGIDGAFRRARAASKAERQG